MARRWGVVAVAVMLVMLLTASTAYAWVMISEGSGVSSARLGTRDSVAVSKLGRPAKSGRDTNYSNQIVYYWCFGRPSGGKYPLTMYSSGSHTVFNFTVSSSAYATSKGIKVGSTEAQVKRAYGSRLRRYAGSTTVRYTLGSKPATDFWCRKGKVFQIVVRSQ